MKKGKKVMVITIGIMSLILVCTIFMQFKVVNETDIAQIENMREDELKKAATDWKEKYEDAFEKLKDTNQKIIEYREKLQNNAETKELVERELKEAETNFGLTDVAGEGIIVTLEDNEEKSYTASDILDLINELKLAGAEAISINNERITNITDIVDISTTCVKVNSTGLSSPYIIKAIGDKTYLKSTLTIKNGYYDLKNKEGYSINVQEKANIKINKYSKEVTLKYIQLQESKKEENK